MRPDEGSRINVDVFRPPEEKPAPPIIARTPYGKHQHGSGIDDANPSCEVKPGMVSRDATFEGPDPDHWVPRGYAVVNVDIRGTWYSQGIATLLSPEEAQDFYDLIERAGTQSWSNGKVRSLRRLLPFTNAVACRGTQPPHLAAMNIWGGFNDTYREVARHEGFQTLGSAQTCR